MGTGDTAAGRGTVPSVTEDDKTTLNVTRPQPASTSVSQPLRSSSTFGFYLEAHAIDADRRFVFGIREARQS